MSVLLHLPLSACALPDMRSLPRACIFCLLSPRWTVYPSLSFSHLCFFPSAPSLCLAVWLYKSQISALSSCRLCYQLPLLTPYLSHCIFFSFCPSIDSLSHRLPQCSKHITFNNLTPYQLFYSIESFYICKMFASHLFLSLWHRLILLHTLWLPHLTDKTEPARKRSPSETKISLRARIGLSAGEKAIASLERDAAGPIHMVH